jgi:hypothetical protein
MSRGLDTLIFDGDREAILSILRSFVALAQTVPTDLGDWSYSAAEHLDDWSYRAGKWQVNWHPTSSCNELPAHTLSIDGISTVTITSRENSGPDETKLQVSSLVRGDHSNDGPAFLAHVIHHADQVIQAYDRLAQHPTREDLLGVDPKAWLVAIALKAKDENPDLIIENLRVQLGSTWQSLDLFNVDMETIKLGPQTIATLTETAPLAASVELLAYLNHTAVMINPVLGIPGVTMPSLSSPTDILRAVRLAGQAGTMRY